MQNSTAVGETFQSFIFRLIRRDFAVLLYSNIASHWMVSRAGFKKKVFSNAQRKCLDATEFFDKNKKFNVEENWTKCVWDTVCISNISVNGVILLWLSIFLILLWRQSLPLPAPTGYYEPKKSLKCQDNLMLLDLDLRVGRRPKKIVFCVFRARFSRPGSTGRQE